MNRAVVVLSLASATLLACATGATLDGSGGTGVGGTGVTAGNTTSKSSSHASTNDATVTSAESSTDASSTSQASTTVSSTSQASTSVASTSQASTSVASTTVSSSASSTGSGTTSCDPENPGPGCGAGEHCVPTTTNMPFCDAAGSGVQWDNCVGRNECGPSFECIDDGITCCAHWCTSDSDCNTAFGEFCATFTMPLLANGIEYGVCYDSLGCL